jgi:hypothetical protein
MRFLIKNDFKPYIKEINLNVITGNDDTLLNEIEAAALIEFEMYIGRFYDANCLLPLILEYNSDTQYNSGDYVWNDITIYEVVQNISPTHSITDSAFVVNDPRNAIVKRMLIDICLYHIHSRISPHQIPDLRVVRYQETIQLLKDIRNGLTGGLPSECLLVDDEGNVNQLWGSNRKINQSW